MAKKGGMPIYKTVDDYINNQSTAAQPILRELRSLILKTVPEAIEIPNCKTPSFIIVDGKKPRLQIMLMAYKNFISFYPYEATVKAFEKELSAYQLGKGTVKFPIGEALPISLIKKMILFRKKELKAK